MVTDLLETLERIQRETGADYVSIGVNRFNYPNELLITAHRVARLDGTPEWRKGRPYSRGDIEALGNGLVDDFIATWRAGCGEAD